MNAVPQKITQTNAIVASSWSSRGRAEYEAAHHLHDKLRNRREDARADEIGASANRAPAQGCPY